MQPIDDRALAARARAGDGSAYDQLVGLYGDRLFSSLLHLACGDRDLAAEFTQEAFVRAFANLDQFAGSSSFYTWLWRLARNRAIDLLARRRPVACDEARLDLVGGGGVSDRAHDRNPFERLSASEQRRLVQNALARLGSDAREIILLRDFEGLDYADIAAALDCPLGTVKSRLNRARGELRALLEPVIAAEDL